MDLDELKMMKIVRKLFAKNAMLPEESDQHIEEDLIFTEKKR